MDIPLRISACPIASQNARTIETFGYDALIKRPGPPRAGALSWHPYTFYIASPSWRSTRLSRPRPWHRGLSSFTRQCVYFFRNRPGYQACDPPYRNSIPPILTPDGRMQRPPAFSPFPEGGIACHANAAFPPSAGDRMHGPFPTVGTALHGAYCVRYSPGPAVPPAAHGRWTSAGHLDSVWPTGYHIPESIAVHFGRNRNIFFSGNVRRLRFFVMLRIDRRG